MIEAYNKIINNFIRLGFSVSVKKSSDALFNKNLFFINKKTYSIYISESFFSTDFNPHSLFSLLKAIYFTIDQNNQKTAISEIKKNVKKAYSFTSDSQFKKAFLKINETIDKEISLVLNAEERAFYFLMQLKVFEEKDESSILRAHNDLLSFYHSTKEFKELLLCYHYFLQWSQAEKQTIAKLYKVAKEKKIKISYVNLSSKDKKEIKKGKPFSMAYTCCEKKQIYIKKNLKTKATKEIFSLAHELYHNILYQAELSWHQQYSDLYKKLLENLASENIHKDSHKLLVTKNQAELLNVALAMEEMECDKWAIEIMIKNNVIISEEAKDFKRSHESLLDSYKIYEYAAIEKIYNNQTKGKN